MSSSSVITGNRCPSFLNDSDTSWYWPMSISCGSSPLTGTDCFALVLPVLFLRFVIPFYMLPILRIRLSRTRTREIYCGRLAKILLSVSDLRYSRNESRSARTRSIVSVVLIYLRACGCTGVLPCTNMLFLGNLGLRIRSNLRNNKPRFDFDRCMLQNSYQLITRTSPMNDRHSTIIIVQLSQSKSANSRRCSRCSHSVPLKQPLNISLVRLFLKRTTQIVRTSPRYTFFKITPKNTIATHEVDRAQPSGLPEQVISRTTLTSKNIRHPRGRRLPKRPSNNRSKNVKLHTVAEKLSIRSDGLAISLRLKSFSKRALKDDCSAVISYLARLRDLILRATKR
ncbi:unnamed protein product [Trichogramma brassicae]|uniref:Uncharacterized protein n=1 Tax=Trichogramma brassicae TaxID=86971 RepID=A0A6H5ICT7_9HYME|nr:unnamed protein product [Trichogramma brassicae]